MRLINETSYDSKWIKPFLQKIVKSEGLDHSEYVVHITNRRGRYSKLKGCAGYAYHRKIWWDRYKIKNKYYVKLKIPTKLFDANSVFKVMVHELAHTRGLRHKDMINITKIKIPSFVETFKTETF